MAFAWKSHTVIWRKLGKFLIGVLVIRALARVSPSMAQYPNCCLGWPGDQPSSY
jgi:hypothetical protein